MQQKLQTDQGRWSGMCFDCAGCQQWPQLSRWGWSAAFCCLRPPCRAPCLIGCRRCAPGCRCRRSCWSFWACCGPPTTSADWGRKEETLSGGGKAQMVRGWLPVYSTCRPEQFMELDMSNKRGQRAMGHSGVSHLVYQAAMFISAEYQANLTSKF